MTDTPTYRAFFDNLSSPAFLIATDGTIKAANHAASDLPRTPGAIVPCRPESHSAHDPGTLCGQAIGAIFPWLADFIGRALDDPDTNSCRWETISQPATSKIYRVVLTRLPDTGDGAGLSLILRDETEEQAAHAQIVRIKDELERTFDTISDLVFFVDPRNVMLRVNKALARKLGRAPRDIVGRTCREVLGCVTCLPMSDSAQAAPMSFPNIAGKFLITRNALTNAEKKLLGYVFVARDMTHLEDVQETLRAVENKYKSIFDHAQEGIFQATLDGTYLNLNPAMARIFGFQSTGAMRMYYTDIATQMYLHPRDRGDLLREGIAKGYIPSRDIQLKRRDGSVFWARLGGRLVRDDAGKTMYFEGFVQDIHEHKMLQSQLLQAQKLEAIGQLAAGIAHEINTPAQYVLNNMWFIKDALEKITQAIKGHAVLLDTAASHPELAVAVAERRAADADLQLDFHLGELPAAIAETMQGLDRITAIVRSVKQFAHPGHDQTQPIDLNALIQDTVTVSRNEWKYVAELTTDLAPDLPPVPCLVHEIGQVLLNLIINAAHAVADKNARTNARGTIRIISRLVENWVEIQIQDSGTGIPEHAREHIFEPFFTTKPVGKGTGQGLYLAYRTVVTRHNGLLEFETVDGQGTTFILRLPPGSQEPHHGL
ncbi:MAG: PAS domain-containing sensor histidine kinase [Deltaproteobacteria bacterium]|nr:PAS domain-containing sensor histidine kinase [Deltaproteobacteria bacterium]